MKKQLLSLTVVFAMMLGFAAAQISCSADFTFTVDGGTVTFNGAGTGLTPLYYWNFGDGSSGTGEEVTHTYTDNGNYWACLTVIGADSCYAYFCDTVTITGLVETCNADFTTTVSGTTVHFINTSDLAGAPSATYFWDFGDGGTSTATSPNHTYAGGGTFYACLTILTADGCTSSTCQFVTTGIIIDSMDCSALYGFVVDGTTVVFTNYSDGGAGTIISYDWEFGDGTSSTEENPTHTFAAPGTYDVCLIINTDDTCGSYYCSSFTFGGGIDSTECNAGFLFSTDYYTIDFINTSDGGGADIIAYNWNFGDGDFSTVAEPSHTYADAGAYNVCLAIYTNDSCVSEYCTTIELFPVVDTGACHAAFNYSLDGMMALYTNMSLPAGASYFWDFGDGSSSTAENPEHLFTIDGDYNVCLTISSDSCSDTECQAISVSTAIEEIPIINGLSLYPNPVSSAGVIEFTAAEGGTLQIDLYDVTGRIISNLYTGEVASGANSLQLHFDDVQGGVYLMRMYIDHALPITEQVVVIK